jgi:hypothetical protein
MIAIEIARPYTGPDDESHFKDIGIPLENAGDIGERYNLYLFYCFANHLRQDGHITFAKFSLFLAK